MVMMDTDFAYELVSYKYILGSGESCAFVMYKRLKMDYSQTYLRIKCDVDATDDDLLCLSNRIVDDCCIVGLKASDLYLRLIRTRDECEDLMFCVEYGNELI